MAVWTNTLFTPSASAARRPNLLAVLADWMAVYRQRQRLADLPPHLLRDLGLSAAEARNEAEKPVWDAPNHWRR